MSEYCVNTSPWRRCGYDDDSCVPPPLLSKISITPLKKSSPVLTRFSKFRTLVDTSGLGSADVVLLAGVVTALFAILLFVCCCCCSFQLVGSWVVVRTKGCWVVSTRAQRGSNDTSIMASFFCVSGPFPWSSTATTEAFVIVWLPT